VKFGKEMLTLQRHCSMFRVQMWVKGFCLHFISCDNCCCF